MIPNSNNSTPPILQFLDLSDDLIYRLATFLDAKDVLRLLSTSKTFRKLNEEPFLWNHLLHDLCPSTYAKVNRELVEEKEETKACNDIDIDPQTRKLPPPKSVSRVRKRINFSDNEQENKQDARTKTTSSTTQNMDEIKLEGKKIKEAYIRTHLLSNPTTIEWKNIDRRTKSSPSEREGHVMAKLGNDRLILTGGFCGPDADIYILDVCDEMSYNEHNENPQTKKKKNREKGWNIVRPTIITSSDGRRPFLFAYGCSLTAIDDKRLIRFGGFQAGGYSYACNNLFLLTITEEQETVDDDSSECTSENGNTITKAIWEKIELKGNIPQPRAYHTATLVADRYLVILGGMRDDKSILSEAILDTKTFIWLDVKKIPTSVRPSGRYGHSVVLDEKRDRLVLFGGASGCDLLRNGIDNAEVWELLLGEEEDENDTNVDSKDKEETGKTKTTWKTDLPLSLPWRWRMVEKNSEIESTVTKQNKLQVHDRLNLARCHLSAKISSNKVLFFGGGTAATNNVILYDLQRGEWNRVTVEGSKPIGRFTAVGAAVNGWFIAHGGYSVITGALGDTLLLDLAPKLNRSFTALKVETKSGLFAYLPSNFYPPALIFRAYS